MVTSKLTFYPIALLTLVGISCSVAAAPSYYVKKDSWMKTLRASMYAKQHPETIKGTQPRASKSWQPVKSKVVRFRNEAVAIKADITGQSTLTLIADPTRDGIGCDHAVWADAKLITASGQSVWLDTLKPVAKKLGWGRFFAGKRTIEIGKQKYQRHIWAHAKSFVTYQLPPGKYTTFEAKVGIDNRARGGSVQFIVDNKAPAEGAVGTGDPFWSQLMQDFPGDQNRILIVKDWCRQDKIDISSPHSSFKPKVETALALAKKTLEFVGRKGDVAQFKQRLSALESEATTTKDWRDLYIDVRLLRRKIIMSHPALNFEKILCNVNPPTLYSHNGDQHLGRHSRVGNGLTILTNWKTGNPTVTNILKGKLPEGATRNPDLNYDADKVLFAFCDHREENKNARRYFLYEAAIDGSWVRQITGTKKDKLETTYNLATVLVEDNDPCYLPDGDIIFISTRCQSFGRCHGGRYNPAWVLYRCHPDGSGIRQISFNNENEYEPSVLNDGRIVFTRWEYTNRHEMFFHMLWSCRPDGTNVSNFYGADTLFPMMVTEASAIPGTHKIVATAMGHHSYSTGTTEIIDTNKGENGEEPITHITTETPYSETHGWPEPHYSHPYAVTQHLFLVSRANHRVHKQGQTPPPNDRGVYLIDDIGGRELVYENPDIATFSPIAVRPRKRPPVLPSMLPNTAKKEGTLFIQNVYLTRNDPEHKIKPGSIKAIRVNALGVKPKPGTSCSMTVPVEIPKKVLGTVPVNPDGSVLFKVPADQSIHLQILDKNGMAIMTERSFFYLQPGERRSCIGCHEPPGTAPIMASIAKNSRAKPLTLKPAAGPQYPGGISFMRTVQPVLDRYCIKCHGLDKTEKGVNLVHDGKLKWPRSAREIIKRGDSMIGLKRYTGNTERNISRPYQYYAQSNKVAQMILNGTKKHPKLAETDRESYMRIVEWLDLNAQILPDDFNNYLEQRKIDANALKQLRAFAKQVVGAKIANQPDRALINVAQPDESRILMMPLAVKAGGWGQVPAWRTKDDPGYKKMAQLVEKCIVHFKGENTRGWQPTVDAGGSERWVLEERKKYRARMSN